MRRRLPAARAGRIGALALAGLASGGAGAAQPGAGYTLHGSGTPAVVLQAGLGDGQASWRQALPALSAAQAVLAIDRPGHGRVPAGDAPRDPCSVAEQPGCRAQAPTASSAALKVALGRITALTLAGSGK